MLKELRTETCLKHTAVSEVQSGMEEEHYYRSQSSRFWTEVKLV
jgi:hypothetical protein